MKKLLFILIASLIAVSVNSQNRQHKPSNKPAQHSEKVMRPKEGKSSAYVHSGTFKFYSDAMKMEIIVNAYGRYSSVVVDGTEFLGTVNKGHIVAKEDNVTVFDGYMYDGGKTLSGLFYGRQVRFHRR